MNAKDAMKLCIRLLLACVAAFDARVVVAADTAADALASLRAKAELGDAEAQLELGVGYLTGTGISKDSVIALKWVRQAAKQGNPAACACLGFIYSTGNGVPTDKVEAVKWYRKAAEQGFASAQVCLADIYREGAGVPM